MDALARTVRSRREQFEILVVKALKRLESGCAVRIHLGGSGQPDTGAGVNSRLLCECIPMARAGEGPCLLHAKC